MHRLSIGHMGDNRSLGAGGSSNGIAGTGRQSGFCIIPSTKQATSCCRKNIKPMTISSLKRNSRVFVREVIVFLISLYIAKFANPAKIASPRHSVYVLIM